MAPQTSYPSVADDRINSSNKSPCVVRACVYGLYGAYNYYGLVSQVSRFVSVSQCVAYAYVPCLKFEKY